MTSLPGHCVEFIWWMSFSFFQVTSTSGLLKDFKCYGDIEMCMIKKVLQMLGSLHSYVFVLSS